MAGKSMKGMKDMTVDNENSSAVEVTSAESILSRQHGSPSENQDGGLGVTKPISENLLKENACMDTSESNSKNRDKIFLDMIRNKLISDFSSEIFRSNLESEINKMDPMQINTERMSVIEEILVQIYLLSDPEKLLLYLKLPNSLNTAADPLTQPLNPLGNRQEIQQAIVWIKTHLEEDKEKSVLKQDVYEQYLKYCRNGSMKSLSTADFGKVMKQVYPEIRPRRLGARGNSRYCYSGMRNTIRLPTPCLPKSVHESNIARSPGKNDYGSVSTEIDKGRSENCKKNLKKPSRSFEIPATVVKDSAPKDENLSLGNEVTIDPVKEQNFTNEMNTGSEKQDNLNQTFNDFDDINCDLDLDLDISLDNVDEVLSDDITVDNINLDLFDKIDLPNEELNVKGSDDNDGDKSSEANSSQNLESAESQPNKFLVTKLPLRIIPITALKRMSNPKTTRFQGGRGSSRSQRLRARRTRSLPQSQRIRRNYVPIRPKPVNGGKFWIQLYLSFRSKRNEVPDLPEVEEEIVKYFRHLEDIELLGVVGGTILGELLKLEKIAGSIFNGYKNILGIRSQSSLGYKLGTYTPVGNAVQGGLPQRSQTSVGYSPEPTVTFQKQGNVEYISNRHLLIPNTENMANVNTDELNTQHNSVIDTRCDNVSVSPSTNNFHFIPISPGPRTTMTTPERSQFSSTQNAQTMPNNNFLSSNNNFLPPSNDLLPPNNNFLPLSNDLLPPNNNFLPSNNNFIPSNNALLPNNNFLLPNNNTLPPNNNFPPPNNNTLPPNNNFSPPNNNTLPPNNNFPPPNNNTLPPNNNFPPPNNNILPPINNFLSPTNTSLQNNASLNSFNIINPGILNGGFYVQNNIISEETFPKPMPEISPESNSKNLYCFNTPENSPEISSFDQFFPNEVNFNEADMENISLNTNSTFSNLSEEIDELLVNQSNFQNPPASNVRSQSAPVNSMTGGEFWFSNNICSNNNNNNNNNAFDPYTKETTNRLDSNEYTFEPISDCETMEPMTENEPFPDLCLDDLAVDSDDITDQMFSGNFESDPRNINFDDNSLNTIPEKIDENNVFGSSFSVEDINSYFEGSEGPMNQADPLLRPEVEDIDLFDNLFDDSTENLKDPAMGSPTTDLMNEFTSYNESPNSDFLSFKDSIDNQLNEYLGLN